MVGSVPTPGGNLERSLLERLAQALEDDGVGYCQWKGHWGTQRWAVGNGDIDLLVDQRAIPAFQRIVGKLGFKPAVLPGERQLPGVVNYFGYDPGVSRLLHLHVHYRLVLGDYWRTTCRLPLEPAILQTTMAGTLFRVPSLEFQLLIFVFRLVLRQRGRLPSSRWFKGTQIQLNDLADRCDRDALAGILQQHLPSVDVAFFDRCVRWLRQGCGPWERVALPWQLHHRLRAHARRPQLGALFSAAVEKMLPEVIARSILTAGMRSARGGTVVALIGGDGSGKSTCARELEQWLAPGLATIRAQMGNPPRSLLSFVVGAALKAEQAIARALGRESPSGSWLELLRYLCMARDCYRLYEKVQRFSTGGGIAVCERYPVSELPSHVGPRIGPLLPARPNAFARLLQSAETSYYHRMLRPDLLLVLQLDPELAVARKPDEPAEYVRTRGRTVWETDWSATGAQLVDASQPLPRVLDDLKARVWRAF